MADIGPWPFDILTRVSKFVWSDKGDLIGAGRFWPGSGSAAVIISGKGGAWSQVVEYRPTSVAVFQAGAVGLVADEDKQTVVVGGYYFKPFAIGGDFTGQTIHTSKDGGNTFFETRDVPGLVYCMAWDKATKMFYAQTVTNYKQGSSETTLEVLASPNGLSWTAVEIMDDGFSGYASPLLQATGPPWVKDPDNNVAPNGGFFGWRGDKDNGTTIAPKDMYFYNVNRGAASNTVTITKKQTDSEGAVTITTTEKALPMELVYSVALAGDVWTAAGINGLGTGESNFGTAIIAESKNDGETWGVVYSKLNENILVMLGVPK